MTSSKESRFLLTRDPDTVLAKVDEGTAIGRLMLKGIVGQRGAADFLTALAAEVEEIRAERKKKIGGKAVLLFEAQGVIDALLLRSLLILLMERIC